MRVVALLLPPSLTSHAARDSKSGWSTAQGNPAQVRAPWAPHMRKSPRTTFFILRFMDRQVLNSRSNRIINPGRIALCSKDAGHQWRDHKNAHGKKVSVFLPQTRLSAQH